MKKAILMIFLGNLIFCGFAFAEDNYVIDGAHSYVGFSVKHLLITNVKGNFKEYRGNVVVNENKPEKSRVEITIQAGSIDTDNEKRDEHLRSADFFDVIKHPTITFKSKKISKEKNGQFLVKGTLDMKGVKKEIEIPLSITDRIKDPYGQTKFGAEGIITINRQDWGVSWNKTMDKGGLVVGNEVRIELNIEAQKK